MKKIIYSLMFVSTSCMTAMEPTPARLREWNEALARETLSAQGVLHVIQGQLDDGADVNYVSVRYGNPLINAVSNGRIDVIKLLLEHGANPNKVRTLSIRTQDSPLYAALIRFTSGVFSEAAARVIVTLLLEAGAHYRNPMIQSLIKTNKKVEQLMNDLLKKQKLM